MTKYQACGKPEGTALTLLTLHPDRTAHHFSQLFRNRQAQAGATILAGSGGVCLRESSE